MSKLNGMTFTSVWDDGSIVTTPVISYEEKSGYVNPEVSNDIVPEGMLEDEYVTFPDGTTQQVCPECHSYLMKVVMVDDEVGSGLHEELECMNPNCEGVEE